MPRTKFSNSDNWNDMIVDYSIENFADQATVLLSITISSKPNNYNNRMDSLFIRLNKLIGVFVR